MINTIPPLLAERNVQVLTLLAVVAALVLGGALAYRAVPSRWRGVALVIIAIVVTVPEVILIVRSL